MSAPRPAYHGLAVSPREILRRQVGSGTAATATAAGTRAASPSLAGTMMGLWLCGVFATSLFVREETRGSEVLILLAASVLWPLAYFAVTARFVPRFPSTGARNAVLLFAVFAGASVYESPIVWTSLGYFGITLFAVLIVLQFNSILSWEQCRKAFGLYSSAMVFLLIFFAVHYYQPGTRLGNGGTVFNPNTIGLVSMSVAAASLALRGWLLRLIVLVPTLGVLLLTDSRSAALGTSIALATIFWVRRRHMGVGSTLSFLVGILASTVLIIVYRNSIAAAVEAFFAVNSKYRGLGTGATGRLQAWIETWHLFLSHPVIGVGFRAHAVLVKSQSSAHNGYLAMLAEVGIVGFSAVMYLAVSGVWRLKTLIGDREAFQMASIMLGVCLGYGFIAMFEPFLINVGNPTSLIFTLAILDHGKNTQNAGPA